MTSIVLIGLLLSGSALGPASADVDPGQCVGRVINAAAHLTGAGLGMTAAFKRCQKVDGKPQLCESEYLKEHPGEPSTSCCSQAVDVVVHDFTRAANLLTRASSDCGGANDACAVAISRTTSHITRMVALTTRLNDVYDGVERRSELGEYLLDASDADEISTEMDRMRGTIQKSLVACSSHTPTAEEIRAVKVVGGCADASVATLTSVVGSGLSIDLAMKVCRDSDEVVCRRIVSEVVGSLAETSKNANQAARYCGSDGNPKCGAIISDAGIHLATASSLSAQVQMDMRGSGFSGQSISQSAIDDLDGIALVTKVSAKDLGHAAGVCSANPVGNEKNVGKCVGDSISAAVYSMTGALQIVKVVDECKHHAHHDVNSIAKCVNNVALSIEHFAAIANEIMYATADCAAHESLQTVCGTDTTKAVVAIAAAVDSATQLTRFGMHFCKKTGVYSDLIKQVDGLGNAIQLMATSVEAAMQDCHKVRKLEQGTTQPQLETLSKKGALARKWFDIAAGGKEDADKSSVVTAGPVLAVCGMALLLVSVGIRVFMFGRKQTVRQVAADVEAEQPIVEDIVE